MWSQASCPTCNGAVASIVWLGVAAEPVAEARRSKSRVFTRGEALIVHVYAVVERAGVAHNLSRVPGCVQELSHEVVLPNRFGTGQIERAVQRLSEGHIGHDGGDVIRRNGLHQNRWKPNRLPVSSRLGDVDHELQILRRTHEHVEQLIAYR